MDELQRAHALSILARFGSNISEIKALGRIRQILVLAVSTEALVFEFSLYYYSVKFTNTTELFAS